MFKHITITGTIQKVLLATLFLLPLLVLPLTEQFVVQSKSSLLFFVTLFLAFIFGVRVLLSKKLSFTSSPLTLPLALFGLAVLASTFFTADYPVKNIVGMGGVYLTLPLLAILGSSLFRVSKIVTPILITLLTVNVLLLITSVLQLIGFGPGMLLTNFLPVELPNSLAFNLSGSSLVALQLGIVTLVGVASAVNTKVLTLNLFGKITTALTGAGALLHAWSLLPGGAASMVILPWSISWSVVLDTLRSPLSAVIGYGPEGVQNAINMFKPAWINGTEMWNTPFTQASNLPFNLFIGTGILGAITFTWFLVALVQSKSANTAETTPIYSMIITALVLLFFLPTSIVMYGITGLLVAFWLGSTEIRDTHSTNSLLAHFTQRFGRLGGYQSHNLSVQGISTRVIGFIIAVIAIAATYGYGRAFAAEMKLLASTQAAQNEDIISVYTLQQEAIALNPYMDTFRRRYSLTNLSIAIALVESESASEEQIAQFSELIQQAIREGRAATGLDTKNSENWFSLGQVYGSLIGIADDAGQWAVTSHLNAIQLAPTNPILLVELGTVFFSAQEYRQAAQLFDQAINIKADLPIGYYYLANTLVELEAYEEARIAYQQTLLLLEADSEDYVRAAAELAELESFIQENADLVDQNQQEQNQAAAEPESTSNENQNTDPNNLGLDPATLNEVSNIGVEEDGANGNDVEPTLIQPNLTQ